MSDVRVANTHQQLVLSGGGIALCYQRRQAGRWSLSPGFLAYVVNAQGIERRTRADGPWYENGRMYWYLFNYTGSLKERRAAALADAKKWAEGAGEPGPWVRNRMGDFVPKRVNDAFPIRREPEAANA